MKQKELKLDFESITNGLFIEALQLEIANAKKVLGIKLDIIFLLHEDQWMYHFPSTGLHKRRLYGESVTGIGYIFINPNTNRNLKQLKITVWHEMIHIRFPKKSEKQVKELTKKYII